ncbi:cytochrome P450 [Nocardia terpenica]|uniref:cytochrome P450 n=1 Tax=Nocardia terpenica TaxID=455432 RepID=UPI002FE258D8
MSPQDAEIPFGFGPRKCIGDRFAMTGATLALATIINRWDLATVSGRVVKATLSSIVMRPHRLRIRVSARAEATRRDAGPD